MLVRCDPPGPTHASIDAGRAVGMGFSFGHPVDARVQDAVDTLNIGHGWYPVGRSTPTATSVIDVGR